MHIKKNMLSVKNEKLQKLAKDWIKGGKYYASHNKISKGKLKWPEERRERT